MLQPRRFFCRPAALLLALALVLALTAGLRPAVARASEGDVMVYFGGEPVVFEVPPVIRNDRTMVPVRFVLERIQARLAWDPATRRVTVLMGEKTVILTIDSDKVLVNGKESTIDAAPFIYRDRTMVPLRFLSETFGFSVGWDAGTRSVSLTPPQWGSVVVAAPAAVKVGERFSVKVQLQDVKAVAGASVILSFDRTRVQGVEIHSGTIIEGLPMVKEISPGGKVTYVTAIAGTRTFSGSETYFEVVFEAKAPGEAGFTLSSQEADGPLWGPDSGYMHPAYVPATVLIQP